MSFCKVQTRMSGKSSAQPQPPKLPKQQSPSGTNQEKNPSQLGPVSPSTIANHYLVSTIPKPNYERPSHGQPSYSLALATPATRAITPYIVEEPFSPHTVPKAFFLPIQKRKVFLC